jgi:hypothetical protein
MAWFEEGSPFKKEIRDNFANAASTVLNDAVIEIDSGPSARLELTDRHPPMPAGMTEEVDIQSFNAMKRAAGEEDPRYANEVGMRNREGGMYRENVSGGVSGASDAGELLGSTLGMTDVQPAETWGPWTPQTQYDKRRMAQEQYAENISGRNPDVTSGMAAALPTEQDSGMQFEDLKQASRAGGQMVPAETWGPGPTGAIMDKQTVPGAETWEPGPTGPPPGLTGAGERHPDVMAEAGAPPSVEKDFGQQLVEAVAALVEKMKGFSLSPEEFAEISNMSPEQLTEVYNNLARQQGRDIHPNPQSWNLMGGEPFQSPESAAIFQGRVPMSENVIRPGESEYSQWNIPSRETSPGFMAQDYAQAQPGTTDWMRQIYPWARNLPENILQRAIQDGDYLRMLMQKAEEGELLPLM